MSPTARLRWTAALAALATAASLHTVVSGWTWFLQAALAVAVVAGAGAVGTALRLPAAVTAVVQVAALVCLLCVLFVPGEAVLGLLPGPAALDAGSALLAQGQQVISSQAAPVLDEPGLRLLTTEGAGLLALVTDSVAVAVRRPAVAGLPLLGVHCTAAVLDPDGLPWGWFALAAAAYALLLAVDGTGRAAAWGRLVRRRGAEGAGAAAGPLPWAGAAAVALAIGAAVLVPPLVPGSRASFDITSSGTGVAGSAADSVNPFIDLRSNLRSQGSAEVLTYRTSVASPPPLRIVTLDRFDGQTWQPTATEAARTQVLRGPLPAPQGLAGQTPRTTERYQVQIGALRQQWLPVPYPPASVSVPGDWTYDPATLNVHGAGRTRTASGEEYSVRWLDVQPTAEQLAATAPAPADVRATYGQAPPGLPGSIRATALQVTAGATTPYRQAVALQSWFRNDGGFTYSTDAPEPRSGSALADFLAGRRGYCVHFASAMAVMARELGIPARVAVGFLPGTQTGHGGWSITLQDAHAWPELYFAGAGWVRFEPTPGGRSGAVPGYTIPPAAAPTGAVPSAAAPSAAAPRAATPVPTRAATTSRTTTTARAGAPVPWRVPVALALVVLVLAAPLLVRALVRSRRWRSARSPGARAEAAWADLLEQLSDLREPVAASATPRRTGARLAGCGEPEAVARLVAAIEASRYGLPEERPVVVAGPSPAGGRGGTALAERPAAAPARLAAGGEADLREDVRAVVAALVAVRPWSATWRWRLLPPSGAAHLRRGLLALVPGHRPR